MLLNLGLKNTCIYCEIMMQVVDGAFRIRHNPMIAITIVRANLLRLIGTLSDNDKNEVVITGEPPLWILAAVMEILRKEFQHVYVDDVLHGKVKITKVWTPAFVS